MIPKTERKCEWSVWQHIIKSKTARTDWCKIQKDRVEIGLSWVTLFALEVAVWTLESSAAKKIAEFKKQDAYLVRTRTAWRARCSER